MDDTEPQSPTQTNQAPTETQPSEERTFRKPVAWLLGRDLIAGLKHIALYSAFAGKLDSRDWMRAEPISFENQAEGEEFWFDYISDTGDGHSATYSIAYLCLSDLYAQAGPKAGAPVSLEAGDDKVRLPRGSFLLVGGDTAYHIADWATLANRFQDPFRWAFEDIKSQKGVEPVSRPVFGIPGNHDYYDSLDGFNRQFRKPLTGEDEELEIKPGEMRTPQLCIPGFERRQQASYVALQLPFGWWLWALDAQNGAIDLRQREFFKGLSTDKPPVKLILATPEPAVVFGRSVQADSAQARTLRNLRLPRPFLSNGETVPEGHCRLDIAGDVHHYARYWGPGNEDNNKTRAANYASVLAGNGGAFLHPSHTDVGEIEEQALYPPKDDSRKEITRQILKPWNVIDGGFVWLAGALVAAILYMGSMTPTTNRVVDWFLKAIGAPAAVVGEAQPNFGPFWLSVAMFVIFALAAYLVYQSIRHFERLFKRSRVASVTHVHYWPVWLFLSGTVVLIAAAIWGFGSQSAAVVTSDLLFITVVLAILSGLGILAWDGGKLHNTPKRLAFVALGIVHAVLQLGVPLLVARVGGWRALGVAVVMAFLFMFIGIPIARRHSPFWLLLAWLVHGGLQVYSPLALAGSPGQFPQQFPGALLTLLVAGALGALMSCVWLGWYLVVALAFNGHNNEAGGAARVEKFRGLVRFRLRKDPNTQKEQLTAYVIAFDDPKQNGPDLDQNANLRLIDVFTIAP